LAQLGLNLGYLLVQIICFFIIFVVVRAWIVKPLLGMLAKRRAKLEQGLEDARIAAEARANAEQQAASILNESQVKASQVINEATSKAEKAIEDGKIDAEKILEKERKTLMAEIEVERNRILADLRGQVAALAIAATQKLIGESINPQRQHELLDEFFSGVKFGKLVMPLGGELEGENAQVTSALPLNLSEQETVKTNIVNRLGEKASVEFHVDPHILGGLIIRVGDRVIDGSVLGQLENLQKSLK
jgi:F-type H+-transporting ATPase subunit b